MRWVRWGLVGVALPVLVGCLALNPVRRYELAARQLKFRLDRVHADFEPALPVQRSRVRLRLEVGVENPTPERLRLVQLRGNLRLVSGDREQAVGTVTFPEGVEIQPQGRSQVRAELLLTVADVQAVWEPLLKAVLKREPATWRLEGVARLRIFGIERDVPFQVRRESGA